jgi:hypothetical protein
MGDHRRVQPIGLGQPSGSAGKLAHLARKAVAAVIDYGLLALGMATIRAYTDPSNLASQKVLLRCGLEQVGEIELIRPTRNGTRRAPLFRISRRPCQWTVQEVRVTR